MTEGKVFRHLRFLKIFLKQDLSSPHQMHRALVVAANELMDSKIIRLWRYNPDAHEFTLQASNPTPEPDFKHRIPEVGTFSGDALAKGAPCHFKNILAGGRLINKESARLMGLAQVWVLPILLNKNAQKRPYGTIIFYPSFKDESYRLDHRDVDLLTDLTAIITEYNPVLDRNWITSELDLGRLPDESSPDFWDRISASIAKALSFGACTIFIADNSGDRIRKVGGFGYEIAREAPKAILQSNLVEYSRGLSATGYAFDQGRTIFSQDVHSEDWCAGPFLGPRAGKNVTFLATPIRNTAERIIGLVRCHDKQRTTEPRGSELITQDDLTRIEAVSKELGPIIQHYLHAEQNRVLWALASHDLRAPVNVIRDAALAIRDRQRGNEPGETLVAGPSNRSHRDLRAIIDNTSLLSLLINMLATGTEEEVLYEFERVHILSRSLARIITLLRPSAKKASINFFYEDKFTNFPVLWLDPRRIDIVLYNLLDNAVKYSYEGTIIRLYWKSFREIFKIYIDNEGIGIPPEDAADIFRPFFRSTRAESYASPGKGLGLSIVRRIMRAHGGDIVLQKLKGPTIFALTFPRRLQYEEPKSSSDH